jgi:DnaJ-class molecular chaperone
MSSSCKQIALQEAIERHKNELSRLIAELDKDKNKAPCANCQGKGLVITTGHYGYKEEVCEICSGNGIVSAVNIFRS